MRTRRLSAARIPLALIVVLLTLAVLPLSAALTSASRPEEVGLSSERLLRIGQMVQRYIDSKAITGAVTIVARKGKVAHYEAHGLMDLEAKAPMRKDAIFRMASMSKPVTAVSILMLVEEGAVRLTDPVSRFIPSFKQLQVAMPKGEASSSSARGGRATEPEIFTVPASREVTVRDLLTHTSGLQSGGTGSRAAGRAAPRLKTDSLETHIPKLGAGPLDFQPGTEWRYSALAGMDTLGRIVEIASGLTYDQFLRQRLFEPLGMKDTFFVVPADKRSRVVTLHDSENGKLTRTETPAWLDTTTLFSGGGGLYSTAEDYIQFAQMLANDGAWNGKRFLSPRSVERMSTNHVGDLYARSGRTSGTAGQGFGLGVRVVMDRGAATIALANGSFGWSGAFGTHFWVDRADQLAAILLIQEPITAMRGDFENAVIQAIVE